MTQKSATPSLEDMLSNEVVSNVNYQKEIASFIEGLEVPTLKDGDQKGQPDIPLLINQLLDGSKGVVGKYLNPDNRDPKWIPDYTRLQGFFESQSNIVENGKLRREVREALINQYITIPDNYVVERGQGRLLTSTLDRVKSFGKGMASTVSEKYLIPLIEGAKTIERAVANSGRTITSYLQKAKEWYATKGTIEGFEPAYAIVKPK